MPISPLYKPVFDILLNNEKLRKKTENEILKKIKRDLVEKNVRMRNYRETEYRYKFYEAVINTFEMNYKKGIISKKFVKKLANNVLFKDKLFEDLEVKEKFYKKYKTYPPGFITISPTKFCNLNCIGCYANSKSSEKETLPYRYVKKILKENYEVWGNKGVVVSGGEPFLYKSEGKTLLDLVEEFNNMFFQVYTNGTLIDETVAKRLSELGNILPAISVEGYRDETDYRRGIGVYNKILNAIDNLKKYGVPFAVSVTATKKNFEILNNPEFYDFYFEKLGASFMWIFQFMPIGRGVTVDLMLTANQRKQLFETWSGILFDKKYAVADFWNSGMLSYGCIAYGRPGGYLYIDWNGNIMPCVFVPYYEDNIIELYDKGKSLTDALFSDLFINGRNWQNSYSYNHPVLNPKDPEEIQNLLLPCSIRDHYKNFRENILSKNSKPEDEFAKISLEDKDYYNRLVKYEEDLKREFNPIWNNEFKIIKSKAKIG